MRILDLLAEHFVTTPELARLTGWSQAKVSAIARLAQGFPAPQSIGRRFFYPREPALAWFRERGELRAEPSDATAGALGRGAGKSSSARSTRARSRGWAGSPGHGSCVG